MPTKADTGIAASAIDDLPTIWDGFAKLVRTGLDISAFGVQIMDLPPEYTTASHDESDTGQQELYVALRGAGAVAGGRAAAAARPRAPGARERPRRPRAHERAGGPARAVHRRRPGRALCGAGVDGLKR